MMIDWMNEWTNRLTLFVLKMQLWSCDWSWSMHPWYVSEIIKCFLLTFQDSMNEWNLNSNYWFQIIDFWTHFILEWDPSIVYKCMWVCVHEAGTWNTVNITVENGISKLNFKTKSKQMFNYHVLMCCLCPHISFRKVC